MVHELRILNYRIPSPTADLKYPWGYLLSILPTVAYDVFMALSLCTQGRFKYTKLYFCLLFCMRVKFGLLHYAKNTGGGCVATGH